MLTFTKKSFYTLSLILGLSMFLGVPLEAKADWSVKFTYFTVDKDGEFVTIKWGTDSEYNNESFTVQRSVSGGNWEDIATVMSDASVPFTGADYQAIDQQPEVGTLYYRIRQNDFDGSISYSSVKQVENELIDDDEVNLYPNPVQQTFFIDISTSTEITLLNPTIELMDATGKVFPLNWEQDANRIKVQAPKVAPGLYVVLLQVGEQTITRKIFF